MKRTFQILLLVMMVVVLPVAVQAQDGDTAPAELTDADPEGVLTIVGEYFPSTPSFRDYGSQPVVFLGDISNVFVEGTFDFSTENLNLESPQVIGFTEGDIRFEPLEYEINLPIQPGGALTDIDNDDVEEPGIGIYTVNFTFNGIGAPFIDDREFIAFSSITYSQDYETLYEINGGRVLVYAPEEGQGFPSAYGDDELLFTEDDPMVELPVGYTVVDVNSEPFTFIRSNTVEMNIRESEGAEFTDFSDLSYTEAFDEMVEMMRQEYAFTEYKSVDWDALYEEYLPQFEEAEAENDQVAYARALDSFLKSIPDGHVGSNALNIYVQDFFDAEGGGVGFSLAELDDGSAVVTYILEESPADQTGIEVGAEILSINGTPIGDVIESQRDWFGPHSTDHNLRLDKVRFAARFPIGETVTVEYRNPGEESPTETELRSIAEQQTLFASPFEFEQDSMLPVEFEVLPSGYGYVAIYSFSDDNLLTLLLWERAMRSFIDVSLPGIIIDMRVNGGGSPDISNVMLGYFFQEPTYTGTTAFYFEDLDTFQFDPLYDQTIDPAAFYYPNDVAVLISPTCYSACEFFTYGLTLREGTEVVGYYPTGGLGGGIKEFAMPDGIFAQFTVGRAVGADNEIHIEGTGVEPTVDVPLTRENLLSEEDPVLDAAIAALDEDE